MKKQEKKIEQSNSSNRRQIADNSALKNYIQKHCSYESNKPSLARSTAEAKVSANLKNTSSMLRGSILALKPQAKPPQLPQGKYFKLDEQLNEEEDLHTEFKNFSCSEIMKEQYKILTKVICGFLNTDGGKIFVGVDNSACVKGRLSLRFMS